MNGPSSPPVRTARLVLTLGDGSVVGALPAVSVATPWWQDVAPVVSAARERWGVEATVLRLLRASLPAPPGGEVTYLAQVDRPTAAAEPWTEALDDHHLRLPYARPGGPSADLAWAAACFTDLGLTLTGPPAQVRTWNLSCLWRLPHAGGAAWLKVVPPFFAHEGALITHLARWSVPKLLGHDGARILMAEIEGDDLYQATSDQQAAMIDLLVDLQDAQSGSIDQLLALGLADWRGAAFIQAIEAVVQRVAPELSAGDRGALASFARGLPRRLADLAACGLPDTLVHSDFHSVNFRGRNEDLTLLYWGDSGVGHPLLDQTAFLDRIPGDRVEALRRHWLKAWKRRVPGADLTRAAKLLAPLAAARKAVVYQGFLDCIEPSEHPYHRGDPADWLGRTAALARLEGAEED